MSNLITHLMGNLVLIGGGVVCLTAQFGWKVGVGVGLLVIFHKTPEKA